MLCCSMGVRLLVALKTTTVSFFGFASGASSVFQGNRIKLYSRIITYKDNYHLTLA